MRTLGHVDGVQTAPETLYPTGRTTAEGVEASVDFRPLGHAVATGNIGLKNPQLAENFLLLSQTSQPLR